MFPEFLHHHRRAALERNSFFILSHRIRNRFVMITNNIITEYDLIQMYVIYQLKLIRSCSSIIPTGLLHIGLAGWLAPQKPISR